MKKLILTLLFLSITISGALASSSSFKETTKLKVKSCFNLLSKKRNEMLPEDVEGAENYLKKKLNKDLLTRHIVQEVYTEKTNKLSDITSGKYNKTELQNLRISGIRLGLEHFEPIRLFDIETDSNKSISLSYRNSIKDNLIYSKKK